MKKNTPLGPLDFQNPNEVPGPKYIFVISSLLFSRYDYWYQPHHNVMISTEWGVPKSLINGLNVEHVAQGHYGTHLNIYDWEKHKLIQKIDLGMDGVMPLEIR